MQRTVRGMPEGYQPTNANVLVLAMAEGESTQELDATTVGRMQQVASSPPPSSPALPRSPVPSLPPSTFALATPPSLPSPSALAAPFAPFAPPQVIATNNTGRQTCVSESFWAEARGAAVWYCTVHSRLLRWCVFLA